MSLKKRTTAAAPAAVTLKPSSEAIYAARTAAAAASAPSSPNTEAANAALEEASAAAASSSSSSSSSSSDGLSKGDGDDASAAAASSEDTVVDDAPIMSGDHPSSRLKLNSKYFGNIPVEDIGITLQDSNLEASFNGAVLSAFTAAMVVQKGSSDLITGAWGSVRPREQRKDWMQDDVRQAFYKLVLAINSYHSISCGSIADPEGTKFEEWCRRLEYKFAETLLENGKALLGKIRDEYDTLYEATIVDKCGGSTRATKDAIKAMKDEFTIADWFVGQGKVHSNWSCPVTMVKGRREINRGRSVLKCGWKIADRAAMWTADLNKIYGTGVIGQVIDTFLTKKGWFLNVTELRDGRGRVLSGLTPISQGNLVVPQIFVKAKWCGDKYPYIKVEYFIPSMTFLSNRVPSLVSLPSAKSDDDYLSFPDAEAPPEPMYTASDNDSVALMAAESIERGVASAPNFHRLLTFKESQSIRAVLDEKQQQQQQQQQSYSGGGGGGSNGYDRPSLTYSGGGGGGGGSSSSSGFRPHTPNSGTSGGGGGSSYASQYLARSTGGGVGGGGGGGGKQRDYRKPSTPVNHAAQQEDERVAKQLGSAGGGDDFD